MTSSQYRKQELLNTLKAVILATGAKDKTFKVAYELLDDMEELYDITVEGKRGCFEIKVTEKVPA